jgi:hypothetical protein
MNEELDSQTLIDIDLAEQVLNLSRKRLRWQESKAILAPVVAALIKQGIEPHMRDNDLNVGFTGDAAKLKAAIDVLDAAGLTTSNKPPAPGDTTWYGFFKSPASQIDVWLHFTSSVCIRKKIGTKMVETDVFETICGDCTIESMHLPAPAPVLLDIDELAF